MLVQLSIRDIVLIDRLDLALGAGMTVLTGETGAGKSILLDAFALALGARRGGVLVAVIVLPLFAPSVIFGAGAVEAYRAGLEWRPSLALLLAYGLAAAGVAPFAMAAACRNALG